MGSDLSHHPEQVARAAFQALAEGRWDDFASFIVPAEVERFAKDRLIGMLTAPDPSEVASQQPPRGDAETPPVVEYYVERRSRERAPKPSDRLERFSGATTPEELASTASLELFVRYLRALDPEERMRRELLELGIFADESQIPSDFTPRPHHTVVGVVQENAQFAHVVYRMRIGPAVAESLAMMPVLVSSMVSTSDGWRFLLDDTLFFLEELTLGINGARPEAGLG